MQRRCREGDAARLAQLLAGYGTFLLAAIIVAAIAWIAPRF
jgi:hypothetical protein